VPGAAPATGVPGTAVAARRARSVRSAAERNWRASAPASISTDGGVDVGTDVGGGTDGFVARRSVASIGVAEAKAITLTMVAAAAAARPSVACRKGSCGRPEALARFPVTELGRSLCRTGGAAPGNPGMDDINGTKL
jgi:hypothetical protein